MSSAFVSTDRIADPGFLLRSPRAAEIFHGIAKPLPIVDFHSHVDPKDILEDRAYEDSATMWLLSDPYKHRAMRMNGVEERFITGDASNREKFIQWAKTVPFTIGNPLFHWTALELDRFFNVRTMLSEETAESVWTTANAQLQESRLRTQGLLKTMTVEYVVTSDQISSDLRHHEQIEPSQVGFTVLPSLRTDELFALVDAPAQARSLLAALSMDVRTDIGEFAQLKQALREKFDRFDALGCRISDTSLDDLTYAEPTPGQPESAFRKLLSGKHLARDEQIMLRSALVLFLGEESSRRKWTMQLHVGAQRRTSTRLLKRVGRTGGYAALGAGTDIRQLVGLLDGLEQRDALPRTILYNLNPSDNEAFATLSGSFTEDGVPGKVQLGPAWWYNDHVDGIRQQLVALSRYSILSRFVGMTSDARSPLSYVRHEYFRRVFCDLVGQWIEDGELPDSDSLVERLVTDVCYRNARDWVTG